MTHTDSRHAYRMIVGILAAVILVTLILAILSLALTRPRSPQTTAATLTALPRPPLTMTPTQIPTLASVTDELLVCQRQVGLAMNARQMAGAANLADDRQLRLRWVSLDWAISTLDDALPGVILGLDVAIEVWKEGCSVYDRVQIEVYDRREDRQARRLTVQARMDDLLQWQAGEIGDSALLERLAITQMGEN